MNSDVANLSPFRGNEKYEQVSYLAPRSGLGKLLLVDLFGEKKEENGQKLKKSYFSTMRQGYRRLRRGWKVLRWEGVTISVVGAVYGFLHLVVWKNEFPSEEEKWMWRIVAVITAMG